MCYITLLAAACLYAGRACPAVLEVRPTGKFSIQNAIDRAGPGDTLLIHRGAYQQTNIRIYKRLTIRGEGYPVIDGGGKDELLIVTADSVTISGLQIQRTGISGLRDLAGIRLENVRYVNVFRNRILNTTFGVYLQNSSQCVVAGNYIHSAALNELSSGNGIHAWKCSRLLIQGNHIAGHRDGIYFEFVTGSLIDGNRSGSNVRYGLHFMFSHNDTYVRNSFIRNGAGVAVMYTRGVVMYGNVFGDNWGDAAYGLLLKDISDSKIAFNRFLTNTVGIFMEGASRIATHHNLFRENGWALRVQASCNDNMFSKNNFIANSFDVATNGTMVLNTFCNNYWDKYNGYDLDNDRHGDIPFYPVSLYAVITEKIPLAMILYRSPLSGIMEQVERVIPSTIPDQLKDETPVMKKWNL
jgi:nitrous oxidase accessory protein